MNVNDIISYHALVSEEKSPASDGQKGMNFGVGEKYSVFMMSLRFGNLAAISTNPIYGKAL